MALNSGVPCFAEQFVHGGFRRAGENGAVAHPLHAQFVLFQRAGGHGIGGEHGLDNPAGSRSNARSARRRYGFPRRTAKSACGLTLSATAERKFLASGTGEAEFIQGVTHRARSAGAAAISGTNPPMRSAYWSSGNNRNVQNGGGFHQQTDIGRQMFALMDGSRRNGSCISTTTSRVSSRRSRDGDGAYPAWNGFQGK